MTTDNMNNFATTLVEMAKAHEQLPALQAEINNLNTQLNTAQDTVQSRELRIIDLNTQIEALNAKLRSVEAERDDASFRELEAEDKVAALTQSLRTVFSSVGETLKAAQPVEVRLEPAVVDLPHVSPGEQLSPGQPAVVSVSPDPITPSEAGGGTIASTVIDTSPAVSVIPDPTVDQHASTIGTTTPSEHMFATEPLPDTGHGIYHGKLYYDMPYYISNTSWLYGGGTQANYDWRPNRIVNSVF